MGELKQDKFRIVVGVDFTEASTHAIHEAMHFARLMPRVELNFVHVMEVSSELHDARLIDQLSDNLGDAMAKLEHYVRDTLYVHGTSMGWGLDIGYHVRVGPAARELHQVAVDVDAELLVVGAANASGLRRMFHRSASEELVREAHVPVVVAHPKDFKNFSKSAVPEPPRVGQDDSTSGLYSTVEIPESGRISHISGLI
ncbi:MAG: universal stress protein [Polyangiales bacterium]